MSRKIKGMTSDLWNRSGIYQIKCLATNKVYVGRSKNLARRIRRHFSKLDSGEHKNSHLQAAYIKYGLSEFSVSILEFCSNEDLEEREMHYFEVTGCCDRKLGFNMVKTTSGGYCAGPDHYLYGKSPSLDARRKMSIAKLGRPKDEHPMYGKKHSLESRQKIVANHADMSGAKNPSARLTEKDVISILRLRDNGLKLSELSLKFGVSETQISRICKRKSWKNVKYQA